MSASLVDVRLWLTRYMTSLFLALGILGNMINVYMFTRKTFRRSSCSVYLLAASIANIMVVIWGNFPSLYNLNNTDLSTYSYIYCKLRLYSIHTLLMISRSFIIFACIDLYALSSPHIQLRSFCQSKTAIRVIIATILIWPLLTIHIAILQQFSGSQCSTRQPYTLIYGIYSTCAAGIVPPVLMTIFSILTIQNRRELRARLNSNNKHNHTLVLMLSSEVIVYVITTILYPSVTLYQAVTVGVQKSGQRIQIETFVSFIGSSFLIYLNSASVFYVFYLASKNYRKECKKEFRGLIRSIIGRTSRVQPRTTQILEGFQRNTQI